MLTNSLQRNLRWTVTCSVSRNLSHGFNISKALDKEHEQKPLKEVRHFISNLLSHNISVGLIVEVTDSTCCIYMLLCAHSQVLQLPPSALQGLTAEKDAIFEKLGIRSIEQLGTWKYYQIARAVVDLAVYEDPKKQHTDAGSDGRQNFNAAFDKNMRSLTLQQLCDAPPHSMKGLAPWVDEELAKLKTKPILTVRDIAEWKFPRIAASICQLAQYEE